MVAGKQGQKPDDPEYHDIEITLKNVGLPSDPQERQTVVDNIANIAQYGVTNADPGFFADLSQIGRPEFSIQDTQDDE